MSENVDNAMQAALQRRLRQQLDDLYRRDTDLKELVARSREFTPDGEPTLNLTIFAQAIADIARSARVVSDTAVAIVEEFVERGLITFK